MPPRFKTSSCTKCKEAITDTQFEQCLGFCEVCHKAYFEELIADEKDPVLRDRLLADLEEAQKDYDEPDQFSFDEQDRDLMDER